MKRPKSVGELAPEAQELALLKGLRLTDPVRKLFLELETSVQEVGDFLKIAQFLGVDRNTVYKWNSRAGRSRALEIAAKARNAEKRERSHQRQRELDELSRQSDERVMSAWRAGNSIQACTGLGSRNGMDRICRLRAKYGVEKVPYRREGVIITRRLNCAGV